MFSDAPCVRELIAHTDRAARLYNHTLPAPHNPGSGQIPGVPGEHWAVIEAARLRQFDGSHLEKVRPILERQLAVRAEDSDDDDDADRTYAFPPPVDLDAYAAACRLPPAEETEDEREARFQAERCFGL